MLPTSLALIDVAAERTEPSGSVPGVSSARGGHRVIELCWPRLSPSTLWLPQETRPWRENPPTIGSAYIVDGVAKRKDRCRIRAGFEAPWPRRQAGRENDDLGRRPLAVLSLTVAEGCCNPSPSDLILAVQAFGVHTQEHLDAMASPLCDLGGSYSPIEPG